MAEYSAMARWPRRVRMIAFAYNPKAKDTNGDYYITGITDMEIRKVRDKVSGSYWEEPEYQEFVAFSRSGRRKFFEYCHRPEQAEGCCEGEYRLAKLAASKWTFGK